MSNAVSFTEWLRQGREEHNLTRQELAQCVSCSLEMVRKIETGTRRPSKQIAERLAGCLGVPQEEYPAFVEFARAELTANQLAQLGQTSDNTHAPWRTLRRLQRPNNLPAQPNEFIGRKGEVETACRLLLCPHVRLLTLTGPPGIGKTRLALRVASALVDDPAASWASPTTGSGQAFTDGVFFVPLAPVTDSRLVISAIAKALHVREATGRSLLESLQSRLRDERILLVLDNFEHVVEAGPLLSRLLEVAPQLKFICTSRVALHLYGEHDFQVPPLALPSTEHDGRLSLLPVECLAEYEGLRLFVDRAQAANSNFVFTDENASAVAEICRRLDGLPLAIELAAARIKLLTPQAILARLKSKLSARLDLLTEGARDLPSRQQTLRDAIEWSYDLLDAQEKKLFRRLSVFVGGCTLEAAEFMAVAVCDIRDNASGAEPVVTPPLRPASPTTAVLSKLAALLDKSLLRQEAVEGEPRYFMLETIREYPLEQLKRCGEAEAVKRYHASLFLALVEDAGHRLGDPGSAAWLERLEREHDNLRAALRWALESGQPEIGLRMAAALWRFWYQRGYVSEGLEWLASFLSYEGSASTERGGACEDKDTHREALARGEALSGAGTLACTQGAFAVAQRYYEESLAIYQSLGDRRGAAGAFGNLGFVAAYQGDPVVARSLLEENLAVRRELGDKGDIACVLSNLGEVVRYQGNYAEARSLYEESLAIRRELGHRNAISILLHNLGHVTLHQGDFRRAAVLFAESLEIVGELGNKRSITECLIGLAGVAEAQGEPVRAAKLFGAAEALHEAIGFVSSPADQMEYEHNVATARARANKVIWEEAWGEGQAMALRPQGVERAIAYALEGAINLEYEGKRSEQPGA